MLLAVLAFISLIGAFSLTAFISAIRRLPKKEASKRLDLSGNLFFYNRINHHFFAKQPHESLFFASVAAQNLARLGFIAGAVWVFKDCSLQSPGSTYFFEGSDGLHLVIYTLLFVFISFVIGDYIPRLYGARRPKQAISLLAPICSFFLMLAFPLSLLFLKVADKFSRTVYFDYSHGPNAQAKQEIIDMIPEGRFPTHMDIHEKKLIESVFSFRERIAREVMVPRVDMFSLSTDVSIREAARQLIDEGYSRTPVFRQTVDQIVGVLMYKDILKKYMEYEQKGNDPTILDAPIETIQKSVLYTPETKKISALLQEFRKKQVHLAIVVDEYGGTEGIVTIEDIIEEIVGEISDEYDEEEHLYKKLADGSWIVDARMNILDIDEELGIEIPQEGDYDTVGGYIFHCTGSIPAQGFVIHHNDFEIEVLRSNDRALNKVRIKPTHSKMDNSPKTAD